MFIQMTAQQRIYLPPIEVNFWVHVNIKADGEMPQYHRDTPELLNCEKRLRRQNSKCLEQISLHSRFTTMGCGLRHPACTTRAGKGLRTIFRGAILAVFNLNEMEAKC
jgi:hypothetical protein